MKKKETYLQFFEETVVQFSVHQSSENSKHPGFLNIIIVTLQYSNNC
jgi:hypothetical protein